MRLVKLRAQRVFRVLTQLAPVHRFVPVAPLVLLLLALGAQAASCVQQAYIKAKWGVCLVPFAHQGLIP